MIENRTAIAIGGGERVDYQAMAQRNFRGEETVVYLLHGGTFTTLHLSKLTEPKRVNTTLCKLKNKI